MNEEHKFQYKLALFVFLLTIVSSSFSGYAVFKLTEDKSPEIYIITQRLEQDVLEFKIENNAGIIAENVAILLNDIHNENKWVSINPPHLSNNIIKKGEPLIFNVTLNNYYGLPINEDGAFIYWTEIINAIINPQRKFIEEARLLPEDPYPLIRSVLDMPNQIFLISGKCDNCNSKDIHIVNEEIRVINGNFEGCIKPEECGTFRKVYTLS